MVLIDPSLLDTLGPRELRSGYAEIVKYALIEDASLFAWLDREGAKILAGDPDARELAITAAIAGKARIVALDEREEVGRRALLNLGHTFGHALEAETGYSAFLLHGEAVALGCVLAFDFSVARGTCDEADARAVRALFGSVDLPTSLGQLDLRKKGEQLTSHMKHDKKREGGRTPFVLAEEIGRAYLDRDVELSEVSAFLDAAE